MGGCTGVGVGGCMGVGVGGCMGVGGGGCMGVGVGAGVCGLVLVVVHAVCGLGGWCSVYGRVPVSRLFWGGGLGACAGR